MEEAKGLEPVAHHVGEAGEFDVVCAHDTGTAKLEAFGQLEDGAALEHRRELALRRQCWGGSREGACDPGGRNSPADNALSRIRLKAIDARRLFGQPSWSRSCDQRRAIWSGPNARLRVWSDGRRIAKRVNRIVCDTTLRGRAACD